MFDAENLAKELLVGMGRLPQGLTVDGWVKSRVDYIAAALAKARADAIEEAAKVAERVADLHDEEEKRFFRRGDITRAAFNTRVVEASRGIAKYIRSLAQPTNTKETPDA
jgi:hypothetical protein